MKLLGYIIAIVSFVAVISCGGGGGSSGGSSGTTAGEVRSNVKLIPDDGSVQVTYPAENQLQLSGSVPQISEGDVLASSIGGAGFLRKVKTVQGGRGTDVSVTTEQASLTDVFNNAQIAVVRTLGFDDLDEQSRAVQDVPTSRSRSLDGGIHVDIPERVIASVGGVNVRLDGSLDVSYDLDTQFRISGLHVQTCRAVLTSNGGAQPQTKGWI